MSQNKLRIDGEVESPVEVSFEDLCGMEEAAQIADVSRLDPQRRGEAVTLAGILDAVQVKSSARYIGLHSSTDNFHASIPLEPIRSRACLIYRVDGQPLDLKAGGPFRFLIPDFAACHTDEIDECANVKFVDHIEFTVERGYDNRPEDDEAHEELHRRAEG